MGIRVKKIVGYGLTDLKHDEDGQPDDDRLDPEGYLLSDCEDQERWTVKGYHEFLTRHGCAPFDKKPYTPFMDMMIFHTGTANKKPHQLDDVWGPWNSVLHDGEFGIPSVVVVVPFCMAVRGEGGRWSRYDDIIDYCEETTGYDQLRRVVELRNGIHPFDGQFENLDGTHLDVWEMLVRRDTQGRNDYRVSVPNEVRALCGYLKLFKDIETARALKPLLYVYWS